MSQSTVMSQTDISLLVSDQKRTVFVCTGGKRDVAPLARRAIKGLAAMLTRDRCLQYQSEADAVSVSRHSLIICSAENYNC